MHPDHIHFSIRSFRYPDDFTAVLQIWSTAGSGIHIGRSDTPHEIEKKLSSDPDLFLVAENDGNVVGTVLGGFDGRRGLMYHLAVDAEHRRHGIATALISELEQRLRQKGCIRYHLMVTPDNQEAISYYEKRGWQKMDLLVYSKDLV
jgi:ribosomal protein S18 acetylase RimI-like enzyme